MRPRLNRWPLTCTSRFLAKRAHYNNFQLLHIKHIVEIRRPVQLYKAPENNITEKPFSVTFLISAYNEEKLIKRCIESIDRAAAKYPGKVDIFGYLAAALSMLSIHR